jgi:hypothetical protein
MQKKENKMLDSIKNLGIMVFMKVIRKLPSKQSYKVA